MQTLTEIRAMLDEAGLAPNRKFGQNFLIDQNLMRLLLELADVPPGATVLEVGPGTGALTEELAARAAAVVAVEIDAGLYRMLWPRLARLGNVTLLHADALSGKHQINPAIMQRLGGAAHLVANLPYNIATPLVAQCLIESWHAMRRSTGVSPLVLKDGDDGEHGRGDHATGSMGETPMPQEGEHGRDAHATHGQDAHATVFERLTFTVQREVAERFTAAVGSSEYGPVSILVALLGRCMLGPVLPPTAFWPAPNVYSRMMRIDVDAAGGAAVANLDLLQDLLSTLFGHRRKQIGTILRKSGMNLAALEAAGARAADRPQDLSPQQVLAMANALASGPPAT
ncbi:MAG: rRNA adenine dimethyltransferase family protein [Planctomycetaceae bacterium]|nr:hypothetical protein [Planctomycetaceae bacterium]